MKTEKVELSIPVEGKDPFKHSYEKQVADKVEDIKAICRSRATGETEEEIRENAAAYMVRAFNYGHDLILRQQERQKATRLAQGPEKQIAKAVEIMVSQGFDREQARALIIAQRQQAGLPV